MACVLFRYSKGSFCVCVPFLSLLRILLPLRITHGGGSENGGTQKYLNYLNSEFKHLKFYFPYFGSFLFKRTLSSTSLAPPTKTNVIFTLSPLIHTLLLYTLLLRGDM